MGNIGTCIYCQKAVSYDKVPLHSNCEFEVLKKIRDYSYDNKTNVTVDSVSSATGFSPRVSQKLIDYFWEIGAFEEQAQTSEKEALEMRRQQLEKENNQKNLAELNKLLEGDNTNKQLSDDASKSNGYFTTRRM